MVVEAAAVAAERASGAAVAVKYVVIDLLFFHATNVLSVRLSSLSTPVRTDGQT